MHDNRHLGEFCVTLQNLFNLFFGRRFLLPAVQALLKQLCPGAIGYTSLPERLSTISKPLRAMSGCAGATEAIASGLSALACICITEKESES